MQNIFYVKNMLEKGDKKLHDASESEYLIYLVVKTWCWKVKKAYESLFVYHTQLKKHSHVILTRLFSISICNSYYFFNILINFYVVLFNLQMNKPYIPEKVQKFSKNTWYTAFFICCVNNTKITIAVYSWALVLVNWIYILSEPNKIFICNFGYLLAKELNWENDWLFSLWKRQTMWENVVKMLVVEKYSHKNDKKFQITFYTLPTLHEILMVWKFIELHKVWWKFSNWDIPIEPQILTKWWMDHGENLGDAPMLSQIILIYVVHEMLCISLQLFGFLIEFPLILFTQLTSTY